MIYGVKWPDHLSESSRRNRVVFSIWWLLEPCISQTLLFLPSRICYFFFFFFTSLDSTRKLHKVNQYIPCSYPPWATGQPHVPPYGEVLQKLQQIAGLRITPVVVVSLWRRILQKGQNDVQTDSFSLKMSCLLCWVSCCEYHVHVSGVEGGTEFLFPIT